MKNSLNNEDKASAAQKAYIAIRGLILAGEFKLGERLPEQDLADRIGVSRTPVREAILRLGAEGIVEVEKNRGAVVPAFTVADLDEIFELRAILESYGAEKAAIHASSEELAELRRIAEEMEAAASGREKGRLDLIAELNNAFHEGILRASGSTRLINIRHLITQVPLVYRTFRLYSEDELMRSVNQHLGLVEALEHRDGAWAAAVMKAHIVSARHILASTEEEALTE